ncbi:Cal4p LALA0_S06e00782g [Lachancea lanzarotensis]|uniref:LALA0S06e00782g1_1 n=1 Tax=Lachancea lanzarotensis TaxID=1245769 RepID=A0A0C7N3X7_9SACH|nr:uncharacterized protein LALA0_S06e00782g [Lachancea lanzarotensis]CEP62661.1 LALA0S06e00782g1_1 [Lachancea lanzarotensis]
MSEVTVETTQPGDLNEQMRNCTLALEQYLQSFISLTFFVCFHKSRESDTAAADRTFEELRLKTKGLMSQTRKVLESSNELGPATLKTLLSPQFLHETRECSQTLYDEMAEVLRRIEENDLEFLVGMLPTLRAMHNCILGFIQICHFVRKLPVQQQYSLSALQTQVLEKELRSDLLDPWQTQVNRLVNCVNTSVFVIEFCTQQHKVKEKMDNLRENGALEDGWPYWRSKEERAAARVEVLTELQEHSKETEENKREDKSR